MDVLYFLSHVIFVVVLFLVVVSGSFMFPVTGNGFGKGIFAC